MKFNNKFFLASLVLMSLVGCASGVTRENGSSQPLRLESPYVASVQLHLSDDAKKLAADNIKFNPEALRGVITRTLEAKSLLKTESSQQIEVEITDFRTRSNFTAVMFGFMAGSDFVDGDVYVKDKNGKSLGKFKVSASYALGGFGGGQDEARMSWLYEEFAKLTVNELTGEGSK